jgi:hypothetical protein
MEIELIDMKVTARKHDCYYDLKTGEYCLKLFVEEESTGAFITIKYEGKNLEQADYYKNVADSLKEDQSRVYLLLKIEGTLDDNAVEYKGVGAIILVPNEIPVSRSDELEVLG